MHHLHFLILSLMIAFLNADISFKKYCYNGEDPDVILGSGKSSAGFFLMGDTPSYESGLNCSVTLSVKEGYQLLVAFASLSLRNQSFDSLIVTYNNDQKQAVLAGQRNCLNESCTGLMFESGPQSSNITFHFLSSNISVPQNFTGFKALYTAFDTITKKTRRCPGTDRFLCLNGHCVAKELVCDGHNNCGDLSDETQCKVSEYDTTWGIVVIAVAVVSTLILVPVFCFLAVKGTGKGIKSVTLPNQPTPMYSAVNNGEGTNLLSSSGGQYWGSGDAYGVQSSLSFDTHQPFDGGASTSSSSGPVLQSYQGDFVRPVAS